MSELKTLKDLRDCICSEESCDIVRSSKIKKEAIKWVKAFDLKMNWAEYNRQNPFHIPKPKRDLTKQEKEMLENIYEQSFRVGLMRIHNITEDDLNDS